MTDQDYITADIYLSAYLLAKGHKYKDLRTGRQVKFVFDDSKKLQEHIRGFYNNEDEAKANELFRCLRDLKAVIFNLAR